MKYWEIIADKLSAAGPHWAENTKSHRVARYGGGGATQFQP
jgi:hypothetical protein